MPARPTPPAFWAGVALEAPTEDPSRDLRLSDGLGAYLIAAALIEPGTRVQDAVALYDDVVRSLRNLRERGVP